MGQYGPTSSQVERLIERAARITLDEAADLYEAYSSRMLIYGWDAERRALASAQRSAAIAGLEDEYVRARHAAASAWRHALPPGQGPWLMVGRAVANAAGAVVVFAALDEKHAQTLFGPWRLAMGSLEPVGPGVGARALARPG